MSNHEAHAALPDHLTAFGRHANCTIELCPAEASLLGYQPSLAANGTFIGIFSLALIVHGILGIKTKWIGFMTSVMCGCILEIAGYTGRIILNGDPFVFNGFIMQIVCITIAPLFFCAAIYVLLSRVIVHIDPSISRFKPKLTYWFFIPCDIVSLILQAAGGAMSCMAGDKAKIQIGVNVSLAGLVFQVFTIGLFIIVFADYLIRCKRRGAYARFGKPLKRVLGFLFLATILVLLRCAYRIAELRHGYFSSMFRDQSLFIALEGVPMSLAVACLAIGHPGLALPRHDRSHDKSHDNIEKK